MKKSIKLLSSLVLASSLLVGCGKEAADKTAKMTNGSQAVATSGKISTRTLNDLYNELYTSSNVFAMFTAEMARQELLKDDYYTTESLNAEIAKRRIEYLEDFLDEDTYSDTSASNGVVKLFNEELLVKSLGASGYTIACSEGYGPEIDETNYTYKEGKIFKCDYSELYADVVDDSILKTLLVEKYIAKVKPSLLDKNKTAKVSYLTIPSANYDAISTTHHDATYTAIDDADVVVGTSYGKNDNGSYTLITEENKADYVGKYYNEATAAFDTDEKDSLRAKTFLLNAVASLKSGETLADVEAEWKENKNKVAEYNHKVACLFANHKAANSSSTTYNWESDCSSKYTNNGAYSDVEGLKLELKDIAETDYVHEEIISSTSEALPKSIVDTIFGNDLNSNLYELVENSGIYYLVDSSSTGVDSDIIINDKDNSTYHIVTVELIKSDSTNADLVKEAVSYLAKSFSTIISDAMNYYLDKCEITVHDEKFMEYLNKNYPKIDF